MQVSDQRMWQDEELKIADTQKQIGDQKCRCTTNTTTCFLSPAPRAQVAHQSSLSV